MAGSEARRRSGPRRTGGARRSSAGASAGASAGRGVAKGAPAGSAAGKPVVCSVRGCGRHVYARGLCQTHHRHVLRTGRTGSIRPYRKRSPGTVKFAGLRLTAPCATSVRRYAEANRISSAAAIALIVEAWNTGKVRGLRGSRGRARTSP